MDIQDNEVIEFPIDGTLDLHTFNAREVKDLVPDYLAECRDRDIIQVRIIHGKGTGTLKRVVHSILSRLPQVCDFKLAEDVDGGWGATKVTLWPKGIEGK
jgi:DNA-nicking Smr family endonuclease